jgi:hypothetical protein
MVWDVQTQATHPVVNLDDAAEDSRRDEHSRRLDLVNSTFKLLDGQMVRPSGE